MHTNGTLLLNAHNNDTSVYAGGLTSAGHFYRGSTIDSGGAGVDPFGYTPVDINGDLDFPTAISPRVVTGATGNDRISVFVETRVNGSTENHILAYNNSGQDSQCPAGETGLYRITKATFRTRPIRFRLSHLKT